MNPSTKNFTIGVVREGLWGMGFGFITPSTVLALALVDLGHSAVSAGLLNSLLFAGILAPQAFSALLLPPRFTHPKPLALLHLPALLGVLGAGLGLCLVPVPLVFFRSLLLFAGIGTFALGIGFVEPHWIASMGRAIPARVRGRFFGSIVFTSSLCATGSGWMASRWVAQGAGRYGYALCFLSAFACMVLSVSLLAWMKPLGPEPHPPPRNLLKGFGILWRNVTTAGPFRNSTLLVMLLYLATLPAGVMTVYLRERLKTDPSWFELFTPALTLGGMAGAFFLGWLLDHRGPKAAFAASFLAALFAPAFTPFSAQPFWGAMAFAGAGFLGNAYPLIGPFLILHLFHSKKESSLQAGLFNSFVTPLSFMPLAYGIAASGGNYRRVFVSAILSSLAALFFLAVCGKLESEKKPR